LYYTKHDTKSNCDIKDGMQTKKVKTLHRFIVAVALSNLPVFW